jgi:hypothetical protein
MKTLPYHLPLDDHMLLDCPGTLEFTNEMCAMFAGGPSQTVSGHVWVTDARLAFRPVVGMPHPQMITVDRQHLSRVHVFQPRWLGLISRGGEVVEATLDNWGRSFVLRFLVEDPKALAKVLETDPVEKNRAPSEVLDEALVAGIADRGRYVTTLTALSFPGGFWHTESYEDLVEIVTLTWKELGVPLGEDFLNGLDLDVEPLYGPEDYETGPGSESWARREQIERICIAANDVLGGDRRFYAFDEDLESWEFDEPVWLYLTSEQREQLLALGVVHPLTNQSS